MILGGNTKALNFSSIENINNHAKNYKRNYKTCQKLFEKPAAEEASIQFKNEQTPLLIENREPSNPLREEVLNWFFSLPLETRFKIITVENSWVINIMHQMYVYYKQDNSTSFEFSQAEKTSEKDSEFLNTQFYFQNSAFAPSAPEGLAVAEDSQNLQTHFSIKQIKRDKHDYYLTSMFLKETRFFSVHANIDCLSLSPKVLDDKDLFLHYFKNFSREKCFTKLIEVIQDAKTKLYSFGFPKWIEKDFHQITAFIISFFEHAILIKFILNYNNKNKEKLVTSLHDEAGFNEFFKLRKEIIFFLNENYPNNKNNNNNTNNNSSNANNNSNSSIVTNGFGNYGSAVRLGFHSENSAFNYSYSSINLNNETISRFIKNLNVKKIYKNVYSNKKIIDAINMRNTPNDKNYSDLFNRKLNSQEPLFEGMNEEDTEKKILRLYTNEEIIIFVDNLIFTKIDSVWRLDFYLGIELFEAIHNLYTDKNALDLIKEFDEGKESSGNGKNKKAKNKKAKVPEVTVKDLEKINFNYYKPYMNKDNLINQNKQQQINMNNENSSFLSFNSTNTNIKSSFNRDYGTINNVSGINNNQILSCTSSNKEKDAVNNDNNNNSFASIGSSKRENLISARNQSLIKDKDRESAEAKNESKKETKENLTNIKNENETDNEQISSSIYDIKENKELINLEKSQIKSAENSENKNFILCNEIVIEIIDNALKQRESISNGKMTCLDDVLDNILKIEKKSKEINKLLTNNNQISSINVNNINNDTFNVNKTFDARKNSDLKIKQNSQLAIECAYDIELGKNANSRNFHKSNEESINKNNSCKNNFIIENHQISIENTRTSNINFSNNNKNKNCSAEVNSNETNNELYSEKDLENQAEDYFNEKETSDRESDSNDNENENNSTKNNFGSSSNNSNNTKKSKKNSNNNNDSDSQFENNNATKNNRNNKNNNRKNESSPAPDLNSNNNQDDDTESNLNIKDKRKKNKKKVQKFYQINIEKMNKKKNNEKNKNENKANQSNTINKSTQTQTSKELNNVNLNLNINNQNAFLSAGINNSNNIASNKKYDKKYGNSKNNNNNGNNSNNSNYSQMTNVNINNNVNIHNGKNHHANSLGMGKGSMQCKEYSKYDYPKNSSKKNSFHKNSFNNPSYASSSGNNYANNDSESTLAEKSYSNKIANLSSIINSKNIKEFNYNYSYSFNNSKSGGAANMNNWNINFNYDLNYENIYNNNSNNLINNPNNQNPNYNNANGNSRKKSNNWSEAKILTSNYYENSRSFGRSGAAANSSTANGLSLIKPNNNNEFLAYVFKLHYDIVNYHNNVVEIVNALKDIKVNIISYIEKLLKEFIEYELSLDVFGSFASDLSIESSDIDLKVNILNQDSINIDYEELIFNLVKKFNALNIFEFVMPIHTASVPIIKLVNKKFFVFLLFVN